MRRDERKEASKRGKSDKSDKKREERRERERERERVSEYMPFWGRLQKKNMNFQMRRTNENANENFDHARS